MTKKKADVSGAPFAGMINASTFAVVGLVLLFLGALGWWLGAVQFGLRVALNSPVLLTGLVLVLVTITYTSVTKRISRVLLVGVVAVLVTGVVAVPLRYTAWADQYEEGLRRSEVAPFATVVPARVLPQDVADQFSRSLQTDPRYVYEDIHPTVSTAPAIAGRLVWQTAVSPNSIGAYFTDGLSMVAEVDADTTAPRVQEHRLDLPVGGEGNFNSFARIIHRQIAPLDRALPPVYDVARREAVVPLVRSIWGIPRLTGLVVFTQAGEVTRYPWSVAQERYPHLRLYPEALVRWEVDTWGDWRQGLLGFFSKREVYKVGSGTGSPPPTLLDDDEQALWVVPLEPKGNSFGLAGVIFVSPVSGERWWWQTTKAGFMSPSRAVQVAVGDPRINSLKNASAFEPKMWLQDGELSYLVPVGPSDGSQVQTLARVDAKTRETRVAPAMSLLMDGVASGASALLAQDSVGSLSGDISALRAQLQEALRSLDALEARVSGGTTPR
jgi:hypothetical protein